MSLYRNALPQLKDQLFLTDGGLETTLIFHENIDLPCFASFDLLKSDEGIDTLGRYFRAYIEIADRYNSGLIFESATWRANPEWAGKLGYDADQLRDANRKAVTMLLDIRAARQQNDCPMVISGCIGPRGDGYRPDSAMSALEAEEYHQEQIDVFSECGADMVSGLTINYVQEAIGIACAARRANIPVCISFTVETDGLLPTGQTLKSAIEQTDRETQSYPAYYMINCAHPTHFTDVLGEVGEWKDRIRGVRANASCKSHAELDESTELDAGDPESLGQSYTDLKKLLPNLNILGGCCGTDHRHIEQMAIHCARLF